MTRVLIDVGNTNAKFCLVEGEKYQLLPFDQAITALSKVKSVAIASVADNEQANSLVEIAKTKNIEVVEANVASESFGIKCGYGNYQNLGIDRWLAVVAAEAMLPNTNVVIVDAGTAMTIDFLTADKNHLGGWIVPGLDLMKSAIIEKAPKVFGEKKVESEQFGTDTPSAVTNGCFFTCVGAIQLAVSFLHKKTSSPVTLLLTGGNRKQLAEFIELEKVVDEFLVFKGLNRFLTDK